MEAPTARHWIFGSVGVVMLGFIGYFGQARVQGAKPSQLQPLAKAKGTKETKSSMILVEIRGAIKKPGIFEVEDGTRTRDLIVKAGGQLPTADTSDVNLVRILRDGTRIDIPFKSAPKKPASKRPSTRKPSGSKVAARKPREPKPKKQQPIENTGVEPAPPNNPNTKRNNFYILKDYKPSLNGASIAELSRVPGIGKSLAEGIFDYRIENGLINNWDELLKIKGFTKSKIEKLQEWYDL